MINPESRRDDAQNGVTDRNDTPGSLPPEPVERRENVGTAHPEDYPLDQREAANSGAENRGHRPGKGSGPVSGSGAGAGGKGNAEDFDSDPQGGGGEQHLRTDRGPKTGADAPVGGGR